MILSHRCDAESNAMGFCKDQLTNETKFTAEKSRRGFYRFFSPTNEAYLCKSSKDQYNQLTNEGSKNYLFLTFFITPIREDGILVAQKNFDDSLCWFDIKVPQVEGKNWQTTVHRKSNL